VNFEKFSGGEPCFESFEGGFRPFEIEYPRLLRCR
jgi:hypothetical protein